jgi:methylmalonyl-CoA mutase C-terminal domain/subunit
MTLFPAVIEALKTRGAGDVLVFGGGIIPDEDVSLLKDAGVAAIFKPGASTQEIIDWVESNIRPKHEVA